MILNFVYFQLIVFFLQNMKILPGRYKTKLSSTKYFKFR